VSEESCVAAERALHGSLEGPRSRPAKGMSADHPPGALPHLINQTLCGYDDDADSLVLIGIMIGLLSSIGINLGQNIQAIGAKEPGADEKPCSSKKWVMGLSIFITGSIGNMVAMAFASATILVPLESSQFVTNIFFSKVVNKAVITRRQWAGTIIAVLGTVLTCVFGPNDARCFTIEKLKGFWVNPAWIAYILISFGASGAGWLAYHRLRRSVQAGRASKEIGAALLPALFAVSSALIGGAQMIVHSKALAVLFDLLFSGEITFVAMMTSWLFWVELLITAGCGIFWAVQMNASLTLYEPLFIIPLLQASYITFGSAASGIFYQEFETLHEAEFGSCSLPGEAQAASGEADSSSLESCWRPEGATWFFYLSGVGAVVVGILLLAPPESLGACAAVCTPTFVRTTELTDLGALDNDTLQLVYKPRDSSQQPSSSAAWTPNGHANGAVSSAAPSPPRNSRPSRNSAGDHMVRNSHQMTASAI